MIKNAIAYITRKRNRTLIIFIILTIVLSCLYSCLTIMKSSDEIEKALYESSNSSISITKKDGNYFNVNEFKDIEKLKEVEEIIMQYDGLAKLKDAKVVSGEQRINREDLSDEFKNVVSLEATNNTKRNILFRSGVLPDAVAPAVVAGVVVLFPDLLYAGPGLPLALHRPDVAEKAGALLHQLGLGRSGGDEILGHRSHSLRVTAK